jgi:hypothetical protein
MLKCHMKKKDAYAKLKTNIKFYFTGRLDMSKQRNPLCQDGRPKAENTLQAVSVFSSYTIVNMSLNVRNFTPANF